MGRPRTRHRHLPERVYLRSGTYWFVRDDGRWIRLGREYHEALRTLAALHDRDGVQTFGDVCLRYERRVLPAKAPRTQADQAKQLHKLAAVFGRMLPSEITPPLVAEYRDRRYQDSITQANRELALLSHVMRYAVEWGACQWNPVRDVRRRAEPPRRRYVRDHELRAVYQKAPPWLRRAIRLALLTGQRLGDLRALRWEQVTAAGIEFEQGKTGARLIVGLSPALRALLAECRRAADAVEKPAGRGRSRPRPQTVLTGARGEPLTQAALSCGWRRVMAAAKVAPFTFHDLRAKSASDDEAEQARQRMGHADMRTTERVYRRAARKVKAGKLPVLEV